MNDMIEVKDNVIDIGDDLGVMELNPEPVEAMNILHIWTDFDSMFIKKDMVVIDAGIENCVDKMVTGKVNLKVTLLERGRYWLELYEDGGASSCLERILANGTDITEQVVDVVRQHFSWWLQRYVKRFVCEGTRICKWYEEVK